MKVVILAGGYGTRICEESQFKPKPMIEIGGKPIIWHIMKEYAAYGYNEFIICAGYKQHVIKEWFANYYLHNSDITFDFTQENRMTIHNNMAEPWKVSVIDTGLDTMTGGRVKRIQKYIGEEDFLLTYGDGVSDVNIKELVDFHKNHGKIATITAVQVGERFGVLEISKDDSQIKTFREKIAQEGNRISAGYMVLKPEIFEYLKDDGTVLEQEPLKTLATQGQLMAYKHNGFWQCMDTQREKEQLEKLWNSGEAPWKIWD